jgi:hypothetical protein
VELGDAVTAVSLLLACWGLYLTRLQVFPSQKKLLAFKRYNVLMNYANNLRGMLA